MAEVRPLTSDMVIAPLIEAYAADVKEPADDIVTSVAQGKAAGYALIVESDTSVAAIIADEDAETGTTTVRFYHAVGPNADSRMQTLLDSVLPRVQRRTSRIVSRFQPARDAWSLTNWGFDELERLEMTLDLTKFTERMPLLPDGYILRPLVPAHVPELIVPRISANAGTVEQQLSPVTRERAERVLSDYAAGTVTPTVDKDATLTAVHSGTPIGAILVQRPSDDLGRLIDIFVAPEHQGQGIGRALLIAALRALKHGGAVHAQVETRRQLPAYHLLRQLGFTEMSRHPVRFWLSVMG